MKYVIALKASNALEKAGITREQAIERIESFLKAQEGVEILEGQGTRALEIEIAKEETAKCITRELGEIITLSKVTVIKLVSGGNGNKKERSLTPRLK